MHNVLPYEGDLTVSARTTGMGAAVKRKKCRASLNSAVFSGRSARESGAGRGWFSERGRRSVPRSPGVLLTALCARRVPRARAGGMYTVAAGAPGFRMER